MKGLSIICLAGLVLALGAVGEDSRKAMNSA